MYWSVLSRAGRFALGLASSIIIVRTLGKHDYGVLSLLRVVLIFAAILAGAGMGQSLLKFLPMLKVAGDREGARRIIVWVIAVQTAAWALLLVASYLLAGWFESLFSFEGAGKILWIAVALEIFEVAFKLVTQVLTAYYDVKLLSIANVVGQAVLLAFLAVFLPLGWGVVGVFAATAMGNLASTAMVVKRVLSCLRGPGTLARSEGGTTGEAGKVEERVGWRRLFRFSFPFAIIGVLNVIVWRQSETIFLARFRGAAEAGFFDLAYRLPQTVLEFVPLTVWPIIMAGVSEAYAKDRGKLAMAVDRYYRMLFLLSAPICVVGATLGGRMIPILYGNSMTPSALPTQLFFIIFPISFFGTPLSMALYVIERSHTNLLVYALLAIVNVGLDLLLIPRFGVVGAVIPVGLVIAGSPFLYKIVLARYVPGIRIPYRFIGKCFLASIPVIGLLPFTRFIDGVFELSVALLVACGLILLTAKKLKLLGKEELDMLGAVPIPAAHRLLRLLS
jgi:O-antigen/teichoic acid export membrane protein